MIINTTGAPPPARVCVVFSRHPVHLCGNQKLFPLRFFLSIHPTVGRDFLSKGSSTDNVGGSITFKSLILTRENSVIILGFHLPNLKGYYLVYDFINWKVLFSFNNNQIKGNSLNYQWLWHDQEEWVWCRKCSFGVCKNSVQIPLFYIVFIALSNPSWLCVTRYPIVWGLDQNDAHNWSYEKVVQENRNLNFRQVTHSPWSCLILILKRHNYSQCILNFWKVGGIFKLDLGYSQIY